MTGLMVRRCHSELLWISAGCGRAMLAPTAFLEVPGSNRLTGRHPRRPEPNSTTAPKKNRISFVPLVGASIARPPPNSHRNPTAKPTALPMCHPDRSEAEWRDLHTDFTYADPSVRRSFDALRLLRMTGIDGAPVSFQAAPVPPAGGRAMLAPTAFWEVPGVNWIRGRGGR